MDTTRSLTRAAYLDVGLDTVERNPYRFSLTIPWQTTRARTSSNNERTHSSLWLKPGRWYAIEVACYSGADGRPGGTRLWIDGQLALDHTARAAGCRGRPTAAGSARAPNRPASRVRSTSTISSWRRATSDPDRSHAAPIAAVLPPPPPVRGSAER